MQEIWKDIEGYEGMYQISNKGNIRSLNYNHTHKIKKLSQETTDRGYKRIVLRYKRTAQHFLIHRLVANTFIPNPYNKQEVNHKNGIKTDNSVDNLEWVSCKENVNHAIDNNLRPRIIKFVRKKGGEHPLSKPVIQMDLNNNVINEYLCAKDASVMGFKAQFIQRCCRGERNTYKGYKWKYKL